LLIRSLLMSFTAKLREFLTKNWINDKMKYQAVKEWPDSTYQKYMIWILSLPTNIQNVPEFAETMMFCPPAQFIINLMKYCGSHPQCPLTEASINQLSKIFLNSMKIYPYHAGSRLVPVEGYQKFIHLLDNMQATINASGALYSSIIGGKPCIYPIGLLHDRAFVGAVENEHYGLKDAILRISESTGMIEVVCLDAVMNTVVHHIYYSLRLNKWRFSDNTTTFYDSLPDILHVLALMKQIKIIFPRSARSAPLRSGPLRSGPPQLIDDE